MGAKKKKKEGARLRSRGVGTYYNDKWSPFPPKTLERRGNFLTPVLSPLTDTRDRGNRDSYCSTI